MSNSSWFLRRSRTFLYVAIGITSPPFVLGSSLLDTYGTYLESILFSAEVSFTLKSWAQALSLDLGYLKCELPFFLCMTSSASMWTTARSRISKNVSVGFLISESLNGRSRCDSLFESGDHHIFIMHLQ